MKEKQIVDYKDNENINNKVVTYELPQDNLEWKLAEIWSKVLGKATIYRHDDFFLCGGDSLKAMEIFNQLQEEKLTSVKVPLRALFAAPTIATLAQEIRNLGDADQLNIESDTTDFEEGTL